MSAIFRLAGGSPSTTTIGTSLRVAAGELSEGFLSRLIAVFETAAGVEFVEADLPAQVKVLAADPPIVYLISFAVIAPDVFPHGAMGHRYRLRQVVGPPAKKDSEAGGSGCRSRAGARGVRQARSSAGAMAEAKQARARAASLAELRAALAEREQAFDREAVAVFVFTAQAEYDGPGGGSDDGSEARREDGSVRGADYVGVAPYLARYGGRADRSDEDRANAEASSVVSFNLSSPRSV